MTDVNGISWRSWLLESIFSSFVDVITGNTKDIIVDRKLEEAFYKCGEMISAFENSGKDGSLEMLYRRYFPEMFSRKYMMR